MRWWPSVVQSSLDHPYTPRTLESNVFRLVEVGSSGGGNVTFVVQPK